MARNHHHFSGCFVLRRPDGLCRGRLEDASGPAGSGRSFRSRRLVGGNQKHTQNTDNRKKHPGCDPRRLRRHDSSDAVFLGPRHLGRLFSGRPGRPADCGMDPPVSIENSLSGLRRSISGHDRTKGAERLPVARHDFDFPVRHLLLGVWSSHERKQSPVEKPAPGKKIRSFLQSQGSGIHRSDHRRHLNCRCRPDADCSGL